MSSDSTHRPLHVTSVPQPYPVSSQVTGRSAAYPASTIAGKSPRQFGHRPVADNVTDDINDLMGYLD
jgi:hypothetical protein